MGEGDAAEGCAESPDGSEYVIGGAGKTGVNEGEAIRLANEIAVDEAQAGKLVCIGGHSGGSHNRLWLRMISRYPSRAFCAPVSKISALNQFG
jgi:hypothetical protein